MENKKIDLHNLTPELQKRLGAIPANGKLGFENLTPELQALISSGEGGYNDTDLRNKINQLNANKAEKVALNSLLDKNKESDIEFIKNLIKNNAMDVYGDSFRSSDDPITLDDLSDDVISKFDNYNTTIQYLTTQINNLDSSNFNPATINSSIETINNSYTALNSRLTQAEDEILSLTTSMNNSTTMQSDISDIKDTLNKLDNRYKAYEWKPFISDVTDLTETLDTINGNINSLSNKIISMGGDSDGFIKARVAENSSESDDFINKRISHLCLFTLGTDTSYKMYTFKGTDDPIIKEYDSSEIKLVKDDYRKRLYYGTRLVLQLPTTSLNNKVLTIKI